MHHARRDDAQASLFEAREDLSDRVFLHCIRLDDRKRALHRHYRGSISKSSRGFYHAGPANFVKTTA
jgi:hypothetical protein